MPTININLRKVSTNNRTQKQLQKILVAGVIFALVYFLSDNLSTAEAFLISSIIVIALYVDELERKIEDLMEDRRIKKDILS